MLRAMAHRGPDDTGLEALNGGELVLGHLRLSIIDLSPLGHQPMATPDAKTWIVYNGEIYNYREIKAELEQLGATFRSGSDTEVVLAAYRQWGLDAVTRFRGMFAFVLWDATERRLHLCRDRFGVKPLYYSITNGTLAFASELKGLNVGGYTRRQVDPSALAEYVQYGYMSAPRSIFADVQTVRPGAIVSFDTTLNSRERVYWTAQSLFDGAEADQLRAELRAMPEEALLDRVEASLQQAFEYRMVADVPVGLFLSGGIDSSIVATLLARRSGHKLRTFTIGYGASEFDETVYAKQVAAALGAEHTEFIVSGREALDLASEIPEIADEPIGDSSLIPTLMVSRLARKHVTVALSADGADELFGGYARYAYCGDFAKRTSLLKGLYHLSGSVLDQMPPKLIATAYAISRGGGPKFAAINDKLRKFVRMSQSQDVFEAYNSTAAEWSPREASALLPRISPESSGARAAFESVQGANAVDRFMHFDMTRYMPGDLLAKVDRASMFVSLEAREPFLDHEMAKLAVALPLEWKVRGKQNKYILRRILARYFPESMFDRPKQGFSAPVADWMRGPLRSLLLDELSPARVREVGLLDPVATQRAAEALLASSRAASPAGVWQLLQLQRWSSRWLKGSPAPSPASVEPAMASARVQGQR
jgi:asparagine synthase (glutamine-hydrolysing)